MVSKAVGLGVELGVGQRALLGLYRDGLGCVLHLRLDQTVQGVLQVVVDSGGVEGAYHPLPLCGLQHGQLLHRQARGLLQCLRQCLQYLLHLPADPLGAYLGRRRGGQTEAITHIVHVQAQRVVAALLAVTDGHARTGLALVSAGLGAVAVVEHGAEQRQGCSHAAAALGQGQRGMLVGQQLAQPLMRGAGSGCDPQIRQVDTQWQGVDEHAQGPFSTLPALQPTQQHGAEHHTALPAGGAQQARPAQVEQAGHADARLPRLGAQALCQGGVEPYLGVLQRTAIAVHIAQAERQGRFVDRTQLRPEKRLVLGLADAQACLGHIVAIGHRGAYGFAIALQEADQLLGDHLHGRVVHDDMVELQGRLHGLLTCCLAVQQAHQRRLAKVECLRTRPGLGLLQ